MPTGPPYGHPGRRSGLKAVKACSRCLRPSTFPLHDWPDPVPERDLNKPCR